MAALFTLYVVSLATSMSGMEVFGWLLAAGVGVWLVRHRPRVTVPPYSRPLLAFVAVMVTGILLSDMPAVEKLHAVGRARFFILYAALYVFLRHHPAGASRRWITVLGVVTAIVGVYGVAQHFVPLDLVRPTGKKIVMYAVEETKTGPLVLGTFNHHLTFANAYLFFACLFVSLGVGALPRVTWKLPLGILLFVLCLWTESRAAWVAVPISALVITAGRHWKAAAVCLGLCFAAMGISYATDGGFRERVDRTIFKKDDLYNLGPRMRLWRAQREMFREHPVLGIGWDNNERHAKEYVDRLFPDRSDNFYGHAHSELLQILVTTGVLGMAAFLWLWVEVFTRGARLVVAYPREKEERWIALGLVTAFVGFHIQGATQWNFGDAEVLHNVVFFWAVLAAMPLPPYNK